MAKTIEVLEEFADSLDSFVGASVVGNDGMSVANLVTERGFDDQRAAAALSQLVKQASESSATMNAGEIKESITTSDKYMFITKPLGNGRFFIQLILRADGNIGAARMYMKEYEEQLLETLPKSARV